MAKLAETLSGLASPWAYLLVAVLAALEASAFLGLFVPGELAVLAGGYVAFQGRAALGWMVFAAALGAIVGDSIGYEIGSHFGPRLRESRFGRRIGAARWARAEAELSEHGGRAVFVGRFIGILRALVPAVAGASAMPYRKFLVANVLGGVVWAGGFVLLGFVAGGSYRTAQHYAGRAGLLLTAVVLVLAVVVAVGRWIARHPERLRALAERNANRPRIRALRGRYRRQLDFALRRLRPGQALGLTLTIQFVALGLFGWAFGAVVQDVLGRDDLFLLDGPVTSYAVSHRVDWLTALMKVISLLGSSVVLIPLVLVVGLYLRWREKTWSAMAILGGALVGSVALYDLIKPVVGRARPDVGQLVATATGFSFPSGHAAQATAVFGGLALVVSASLHTWNARVAVWVGAVALVILIGFSRVYLGVHWISDVVGGYALGALWLTALLTSLSALGIGQITSSRRTTRSRPRPSE